LNSPFLNPKNSLWDVESGVLLHTIFPMGEGSFTFGRDVFRDEKSVVFAMGLHERNP
jgi:hypothetical protein